MRKSFAEKRETSSCRRTRVHSAAPHSWRGLKQIAVRYAANPQQQLCSHKRGQTDQREAAPTPRSVRRPGKPIWAGRSRSLLTVPAYAEMGGVEFRMRPARQIQQLATARQRRSKRTDQQRATTPGAAFGDSGGRGVQNELTARGVYTGRSVRQLWQRCCAPFER
jgi:hypothetical protein